MEEREFITCPIQGCERKLKTTAGLFGHLALTHGIGDTEERKRLISGDKINRNVEIRLSEVVLSQGHSGKIILKEDDQIIFENCKSFTLEELEFVLSELKESREFRESRPVFHYW